MQKRKGDERREDILGKLKKSDGPVKGADLARETGVSRQVIVGDITLLKAHGEPIVATSAGYVYTGSPAGVGGRTLFERKIACTHTADETEEELLVIVDAGAAVRDVTVEHPVYGELTANIMAANRHDVGEFLKRVEETGSPYLLELTGGPHLHTITADTEEILDRAEQALREKGFLTDEG
ncbi:transcription repressor NadR [Bhargavaea cecembensis]|uniref:transcription repressor NadR n=1 Tax=Bhargavaea cecembensis TaxID=394098 RepID=UPI00058BF4B0|nr:transcription repressor NadR [Bhargavaea cecembensis]